MRLLLASASPARRATLRSAGIEPLVRVSGVDEDAVLAREAAVAGQPLHPADAVLALARAKADAVLATLDEPGAAAGEAAADPLPRDLLVLGCDSLLELDGEPLGKPADPADAVARWRSMRGRSGVLHTGHWLVDARPDGTAMLGATASTRVHFADLTDAEVDAYVATGEPLLVAGAFTVDGLGGPFVRGIEGDYHTVVGLSLPLLRELLGEVGLTVADLWSADLVAGPVMPGTPGAHDGPGGPGLQLRAGDVVVRSMTGSDAAALAAYRSDPEVARYQSWEAPYPLADAEALVAAVAGKDPVTADDWVQLAIEVDGRQVGDVAALVHDEGRQARIGVTLAPDAHGHGYATRALTALIDHLVAHGVHRVVADCDGRNTASARLLERVGMRREAEHRSAAWWKGEWTDELVFAVLADEWPLRRTGGRAPA